MMTSNPSYVDKALLTAVIAAMGNVPLAYEGVVFDPPSTGVYAEVTNVPGHAFAATLGSGGEDEHTGFFQVDIYQPKDEGTKQTTELIDTLYKLFPAGRGLMYQQQSVTVSGFQRGGRRDAGTRNCISVTIYWRAHLVRTPV